MLEENLNNQIKDLFNLARLGDISSIKKLSQISEIILCADSPIIKEINNELITFINKHSANIKKHSLNLNEIKINNKIIKINPINILGLIPNIFKDKTFFFIKVSLVLNPEISQKLIIIQNIRENKNELA